MPDFQGSREAMRTVMDAAPDVLNHNIETVPRLYREVRLGARYERSLEMLAYGAGAAIIVLLLALTVASVRQARARAEEPA